MSKCQNAKFKRSKCLGVSPNIAFGICNLVRRGSARRLLRG